jgi:hypothetical protein
VKRHIAYWLRALAAWLDPLPPLRAPMLFPASASEDPERAAERLMLEIDARVALRSALRRFSPQEKRGEA